MTNPDRRCKIGVQEGNISGQGLLLTHDALLAGYCEDCVIVVLCNPLPPSKPEKARPVASIDLLLRTIRRQRKAIFDYTCTGGDTTKLLISKLRGSKKPVTLSYPDEERLHRPSSRRSSVYFRDMNPVSMTIGVNFF